MVNTIPVRSFTISKTASELIDLLLVCQTVVKVKSLGFYINVETNESKLKGLISS